MIVESIDDIPWKPDAPEEQKNAVARSHFDFTYLGLAPDGWSPAPAHARAVPVPHRVHEAAHVRPAAGADGRPAAGRHGHATHRIAADAAAGTADRAGGDPAL